MGKVDLVAIEHDEKCHRLLAFSMYRLLSEEVIPRLTNSTVIVVEGGKRRGQLKPGDKGYDVIYGELGPIALSGIYPTLHADDARWHDTEDKVALENLDALTRSEDYVRESFRFHSIPQTWEDMVAIIRKKQHFIEKTRQIPSQLRALWRQHVNLTNVRDETFALQINTYATQGTRVFFIGGVLHCITLSASWNWPVIRYKCKPEHIHSFYKTWCYTNLSAMYE
jgi:hypothetical protein